MEKTIKLRAATAADELHCHDGELLDSDYIFAQGGGIASGGRVTADPTITLATDGRLTLPAGASFLAVHQLPGMAGNAILRLADGNLACLPLEGSSEVRSIGFSGPVSRIVGVGSWLAVLSPDALRYARWSGTAYTWFGEAPGAPSGSPAAEVRPLAPYSYAAGSLPVMSVSVAVKPTDSPTAVLDWLAGRTSTCSQATRQTVVDAVRTRFKAFVRDVRDASLHLSPLKVSLSRRLTDGSLWASSAPTVVRASADPVTLGITAADCSDGMLYLVLTVSRAPFAVVAPAADVNAPWQEFVEGSALIKGDERYDFNPEAVSNPAWLNSASRGFTIGMLDLPEESLPEPPAAFGGMDAAGIPGGIFSVGGRLLATRAGASSSASNAVLTSSSEYPFVCMGEGVVGGGSLLHLTNSLRSVSSAQSVGFPLYAFGSDGVHALTPVDGEFRNVQLLSRAVACGPDSFAPMPDATAFVSEQGVMKAAGTTVTLLSAGLDRRFDASDRLLYLFRENALLLYRPGETGLWRYELGLSRWSRIEGSAGECHYCWPEAWMAGGGKLGVASLAASAGGAGRAAADRFPVALKTRSIKLGEPFALKKLSRVEAAWPDGSLWPLKVYGALRLDKWYFLGLTDRGRMQMRGSGWRYFRVETFGVRGDEGYLLPMIRFVYEAD